MTVVSRPLTLLVPLLACGILASGCTSDSSTSASADPTSSSTACDEVVAGIDAFNLGDLDETVAAFERALPLAEAEDAAAGTQRSADLLEAVQYYAELAPDDYLLASTSSPDFAEYKAITLGQCALDGPAGPGGGDDEGGVLA